MEMLYKCFFNSILITRFEIFFLSEAVIYLFLHMFMWSINTPAKPDTNQWRYIKKKNKKVVPGIMDLRVTVDGTWVTRAAFGPSIITSCPVQHSRSSPDHLNPSFSMMLWSLIGWILYPKMFFPCIAVMDSCSSLTMPLLSLPGLTAAFFFWIGWPIPAAMNYKEKCRRNQFFRGFSLRPC